MLMMMFLVNWQSSAIVGMFVEDPSTANAAIVFLEITSWSLLAQGVVTTCSSMFQGVGNTVPALISSCVRLLSFSIPAIWLSGQSMFHVEQVWYLAVVTLIGQGVVSLWLLRMEFQRRLLPPIGIHDSDAGVSRPNDPARVAKTQLPESSGDCVSDDSHVSGQIGTFKC
jgi:Na+-driven multidrug efflux pump